MLYSGSDYDDCGFSAYDEDLMRELDEYDGDHFFDYVEEDHYPPYEEECWHRPVASTGTCFICNPEWVEWDILDYSDNVLDQEHRLLNLDDEWDDYSPLEFSPEEELTHTLIGLGLNGEGTRRSARGRRRHWYQPGRKQRRRQDHGTANSCYLRDSWEERPCRSAAKRAAIEDSKGLNKITAEFELNYEPVGGEYDEDYAVAMKRLETRLRHTRRAPAPMRYAELDD